MYISIEEMSTEWDTNLNTNLNTVGNVTTEGLKDTKI